MYKQVYTTTGEVSRAARSCGKHYAQPHTKDKIDYAIQKVFTSEATSSPYLPEQLLWDEPTKIRLTKHLNV
jgi:hypothetical protein